MNPREGKARPGRVDGKVALVTGAGRGIGRAIVQRLAEEGARIAIGELDPETGSATSGELVADGAESIFVEADVSSERGTEALCQSVMDHYGRIDILVNNAGGGKGPHSFWETDEVAFRGLFNVSTLGSFFLSRAVAKASMIPNRAGKIVNISSITAEGWPSASPGHSASKAGSIALTWYMAGFLAEHDINVNAVCPGSTVSGPEWVENVIRNRYAALGQAGANEKLEGLTQEGLRERFLDENPFRRLNEVEDIANAVLFLTSDEANNVTGQILDVDGGRRALSGWTVMRFATKWA